MAVSSNIYKEKSSSFESKCLDIKAITSSTPQVALEQIKTLETALGVNSNHLQSFELSLLKGMCLLQLSELEQAEKHFNSCLELSERTKNTLNTVRTKNFLTQIQFRQNKLQDVLISGNETLSLAKEINAYTEQALAYNNIGIAFGALYAYEDSLDALLSGLELKNYLDAQLLYKLNNNTSNVYYFLGHYELALDTLKEAIYHVDIEENPRIHILSEMNFGKIHTKLNQLDTATLHLEKAKAVAEQHEAHADLLPGLYQNLGDLYESQGAIDEATKTFQQAISLTEAKGNTSYSASLSVHLAQCYMKKNNFELAQDTLTTTFEMAQDSYSDVTRLNAHKAYSELYEILGDYKTALEHYKSYHDLKEDVQNERSQSRMQGMMIKNDTERIQNEHKRLAAEKELAILKLEQDNKKLVEENTRDGLTGAYNRRYLNEKLESLFIVAKENKSPLTVMMSDIDFFKQVNDTFSHAIGDEVLRIISRIFMDNTRKVDTVARYGGEEFVVIFERTHKGTAITIAEKLRALVEDYPWKNIHPDLKITISAGLASGTEYKDYEALLNHADKYMYTAKRSGKNQVQY